MRITKANLCYRFNTSDGWTRQAVADLLKCDNALDYVLPRYFDSKKEIEWQRGWIYKSDAPHADCDYFAIHNGNIEQKLDMAKILENHTIS